MGSGQGESFTWTKKKMAFSYAGQFRIWQKSTSSQPVNAISPAGLVSEILGMSRWVK
jgi:hypothetical protein